MLKFIKDWKGCKLKPAFYLFKFMKQRDQFSGKESGEHVLFTIKEWRNTIKISFQMIAYKKMKKHLCRKKMPLKFGKIEWKVP